jgi:hypothetical protein
MRPAARGALVLALGAAGWVTAPALAAGGLPYRVAIYPTWGAEAGSDAFLSDLSHALADALSHGCYAGVEIVDDVPAEAQVDLLLSVVLSDVLEELTFEDSISGALQPGEPTKELRRVARFEVSVASTLETLVTRRPVESKRLVASISRRPLVLGEDPQVTARQLAIERIVSDLRKAYCRGGAKLLRKIQKALDEPLAEDSKSR